LTSIGRAGPCCSANFPGGNATVQGQLDPEFEVLRRLKPEEVPPTIGNVMQPPTSVLSLVGEGNGDDVLPHIERLLRGRPDVAKEIADLRAVEATIVVGSTTHVAEALPDILDGATPSLDPLAGTSRAWSQRLGSGGTVLFVSTDEVADLPDLLTALRYYRNKSFVIREEGATDSGVLLAEHGRGLRRCCPGNQGAVSVSPLSEVFPAGVLASALSRASEENGFLTTGASLNRPGMRSSC
jgi:hypothetical protein